jgi:hypothetical protein
MGVLSSGENTRKATPGACSPAGSTFGVVTGQESDGVYIPTHPIKKKAV